MDKCTVTATEAGRAAYAGEKGIITWKKSPSSLLGVKLLFLVLIFLYEISHKSCFMIAR